jgi:hypothetical protein
MREPGSSVSIVSGYWLDDRAIEVRSPAKAKDFSSSSVSRPALGPTQPPVQWVPGVLSPGLKRGRGVTLTTQPYLVPRSRMSRSYTPLPPSGSVACSGTALALARHMRSSVKCPCRLNYRLKPSRNLHSFSNWWPYFTHSWYNGLWV